MADVVKISGLPAPMLEEIAEYIKKGFSPVAAIGKAMKAKGWQNLDIGADEIEGYFSPGDNVAIRMGKTESGNYVTVDIDCPEAHNFRHYLPQTEMWHGRENNQYSHATYTVLGDDPMAIIHFKDANGGAVLDLLGEKSAVIVYPSIHPGGDQYVIHGPLSPTPIQADELLKAVKKMYLATLALIYYPAKGGRHDYALGLSGLLIKGSYGPEDAREIIVDVAKAAGDEEWKMRADCINTTITKHANGEQVAGYTLLVDIIGEQPVKKMATALQKPIDGSDLVENKKKAIVEELNKIHAVCMIGGKTAILNEVQDPAFGHSTISLSGAADFKLCYLNQRLRVSPPGENAEYETYADIWLKHVDRRQYHGIVFDPQDTPENYYNLFLGFAVEPVEGNCNLFLSHLRDVICRGNEEHYDYLIRWMAHLVQKPWELPEVAIVIRGKQGTGKTTLVAYFGALFGQHFITVTGMKQVTGQFNGHLADKLLVCANEAIWGGDKIGEGVLKALITDPTAPIEYKFRDLVNVRNYKRLIVTTNESWAVPIGVDDRRYVVLDASDAYKENKEYFAAVNAEMETG